MQLTKDIYLIGSGQYGISHSTDCSVYLIKAGPELALIDSGSGIAPASLIDNVEEEGFDPHQITHLLLTHAHADHAGGAKVLQQELDLQILVPEGTSNLLASGTEQELGLDIAKRSGVYPEDYDFPHCRVDHTVKDGDVISVGRYDIQALRIPGHSPNSTCYQLRGPDRNSLFSGDVVFFQGEIGLLNCAGSTLAGYRQHFHKLMDLDFEGLFPGHKVFVLRDGKKHVEQAGKALRQLAVPPTFF